MHLDLCTSPRTVSHNKVMQMPERGRGACRGGRGVLIKDVLYIRPRRQKQAFRAPCFFQLGCYGPAHRRDPHWRVQAAGDACASLKYVSARSDSRTFGSLARLVGAGYKRSHGPFWKSTIDSVNFMLGNDFPDGQFHQNALSVKKEL